MFQHGLEAELNFTPDALPDPIPDNSAGDPVFDGDLFSLTAGASTGSQLGSESKRLLIRQLGDR